MRKPGDLPQKICATCGRPFRWRKAWANVWEDVKYCSDRCRGGRQIAAGTVGKKAKRLLSPKVKRLRPTNPDG
jgi:hypothetical protein